MRITAIGERTVALGAPMRNAAIGFDEMTASVVAVATDAVRGGRPVVGYGVSSAGRYGHGGLLRERFIPRLLAAAPAELLDDAGANLDPAKAWAAMMRNEKPGGHGERSGAVGVLETALWDAVAKLEERPLWRVLAERYNAGRADETVAVYASGGHYRSDDDDAAALAAELGRYAGLGYRTAKIKAGLGGLDDDRRRIEAGLGCGLALAIDLNCAFADAETALRYAEAVAPYGLAWIEEICDPLDFAALARIAEGYAGPLAAGENLFSAADARNLLRHGGLRPDRDLLQFDIELAYGLVEYLRMLAGAEAMGWSRRRFFPHAGHLVALHAAAGLGLGGHETAPDDAFVFGLGDRVRIEDGRVRPPDLPGIGFEGMASLEGVLRSLAP